MLVKDKRDALNAIGTSLGPDVLERTLGLFDEEQQALVKAQPATATNIAYGEHPRHRLDIYQPAQTAANTPVLLFVYGGGFLKGDKGSDEHWHNANVGRMAAQAGFVGVVINYRLAPDHQWPAGGEDVAAATGWVRNNIQQYSGDPDTIFLMGTSAGAVHLATYLKLNPNTDQVKGLILLSGLYGFTPLDERDTLYYGDHALYSERMPRDAMVKSQLPLLVACAEFDPPRFQAEFVGLLNARLAHHGKLPKAIISTSHNHYSLAIHIGSSDNRLRDEIVAFVEDHRAS